MNTKEVIELTDIETITNKFNELAPAHHFAKNPHPLFLKGVFLGMEIMAASISASILERKKLAHQETKSEASETPPA